MSLCAVKVSSHTSSWAQLAFPPHPIMWKLHGANDKESLWSFSAAALGLLQGYRLHVEKHFSSHCYLLLSEGLCLISDKQSANLVHHQRHVQYVSIISTVHKKTPSFSSPSQEIESIHHRSIRPTTSLFNDAITKVAAGIMNLVRLETAVWFRFPGDARCWSLLLQL